MLRYHPAAADAVVVGLPDPAMGEFLVALVATNTGQRARSTEEVGRFCSGRITGFKVPRRVLTVAAIRRDGNQVDRHWARATAAARLGSRVAR